MLNMWPEVRYADGKQWETGADGCGRCLYLDRGRGPSAFHDTTAAGSSVNSTAGVWPGYCSSATGWKGRQYVIKFDVKDGRCMVAKLR